MTKIKNIVAFTSIRSEYGPLRPVLQKIKADEDLELDLVIGGAHLSNKFGYSKDQIVADGFKIEQEIDFLPAQVSDSFITDSMSVLQREFGKWLVEKKPDLLLVLGDRFELIPVVSSALIYNIPVAHISGGDITEGAIDNQIRNAVSKMAHLHFAGIEWHRHNLLKMGEESWRICVAGEPALDDILNLNFIPKKKLFNELGLDENVPVICCTFHPETIDKKITAGFIKDLLNQLALNLPWQVLVTASNFDQGGIEINEALKVLSEKNKQVVFVPNLGQLRYYSLLKYATLMLGNSSSGIIEAQSFLLPVVNVGDRQKGRYFNPNVFQAEADIGAITRAVEYVISDSFKSVYINEKNGYGDGSAAQRIVDFIKAAPVDRLLKKNG